MSWSIQFIGKPEKVNEALEAQSETMKTWSGDSKAEFDAALPHLKGLVSQNFGTDQLVKLAASGHGVSGGEKPTRQLSMSLVVIYGVLV